MREQRIPEQERDVVVRGIEEARQAVVEEVALVDRLETQHEPLVGDALLAHGLVRIAETGATGAVADLGELLALCAQGRADGLDGDGAAWAATAALLDRGGLDDARRALRLERCRVALEHLARATVGDGRVDEALAAHSARLR